MDIYGPLDVSCLKVDLFLSVPVEPGQCTSQAAAGRDTVIPELEMQKPLVIAGGWCVHVTLGK